MITIANTPFYHWVWPWIGLGFAVALCILLFCTDLLRSNINKKRWQDPVWLGWLGTMSYMFHNCEEYGIDLTGTIYPFPNLTNATMGDGSIALPAMVFTAINVSLVWFAGSTCAVMAKRFPLMGFGLLGIMLTNALSHIGTWIATGNYNAGALTSMVWFIPVSLFVFWQNFGKNGYSWTAWICIVGWTIAAQLILMGSMSMYFHGIIGENLMTVIQVCNGVLFVVAQWVINNIFIKKQGA